MLGVISGWTRISLYLCLSVCFFVLSVYFLLVAVWMRLAAMWHVAVWHVAMWHVAINSLCYCAGSTAWNSRWFLAHAVGTASTVSGDDDQAGGEKQSQYCQFDHCHVIFVNSTSQLSSVLDVRLLWLLFHSIVAVVPESECRLPNIDCVKCDHSVKRTAELGYSWVEWF